MKKFFSKVLNINTFMVLILLILVISVSPILYCGWYNYATGDDLGKAAAAHVVLKNGGSIFEAFCAAVFSAIDQWKTWEGTWFSNFVLSFGPSIFGEKAYAITVPLALFYISLGTGYLLYEVTVKWIKIDKKILGVCFLLQLILIIQYMPYIRGGIFWYTGMAHYQMPLFFAFLIIAWALKWIRTSKRRYFFYIMLASLYEAGSHYQQIIITLLVIIAIWCVFEIRKKKEISIDIDIRMLWIPVTIIIIGLIICVESPGNVFRGGEEFGFYFGDVIITIFNSIIKASEYAVDYVAKCPVIISYMVFVLLLSYRTINIAQLDARYVSFEHPVLAFLYLYLLFCSTEAPGLYAKTNDISGGYFVVDYIVFMMVITIYMTYLAGYLKKHKIALVYMSRNSNIRMLFLALALFSVFFTKRLIHNSWAYQTFEYIKEGHMKDYVEQMEERLDVLENDQISVVVLPEMNNEQGPYMHMPLTSDTSSFTNWATAQFYEKESVRVVSREEYYRVYAKQQGQEIPPKYKKLYGLE